MNTPTPPRKPGRPWASPSSGSPSTPSPKPSANGLLDDETLYLLTNTAMVLPKQKVTPRRGSDSPSQNRNIKNFASKLFSSPQAARRHPSLSPSRSPPSIDWNSAASSPLRYSNLKSITEDRLEQQRRRRKAPQSLECALCSEPLANTLEGDDIENTIELKCSDFVHEKCLVVMMQDGADSANVWPNCGICGKQAAPLDAKTADELIIAKLVTVTRKEDEKRLNGSPGRKSRPSNTISALGATLPKQPPFRSNYRSPVMNSHSRSSSLRLARSAPKGLAPAADIDIFVPSHKKKTSRGSSISAISSIISSVSDTSPTSTTKIEEDDGVKLAMKRSMFLSSLLDLKELKLTDSMLDSFGLLRLADRMLVSKDEINWTLSYCYLFTYQLLVVDNKKRSYYTVRLVSGMSNSSIDIPQISTGRQCIAISTPSPSVIKLSTLDKGSIFLSGTVSPIVEKWGAALSDLTLTFPHDVLSGSIELDDYDEKRQLLPTIHSPVAGRDSMLSLGLEKPTTMLLLVNQLTPTKESLVVVKNIILSMTLIKIEVVCIFTYDETPNLDSPVAVHDVADKDPDEIAALITRFHEFLQAEDKLSQGKLCDIYSSYISARQSTLDKITTVAVSTTPLRELKAFPTQQNVFVEVTTTPEMKAMNNRHSVMNVTSWDDVMEYICQCAGLEFDESDFESSDDSDEDEDDDDDDDEEQEGTVSPTAGLNGMPARKTSGLFEGRQRWSDLVKDIESALRDN